MLRSMKDIMANRNVDIIYSSNTPRISREECWPRYETHSVERFVANCERNGRNKLEVLPIPARLRIRNCRVKNDLLWESKLDVRAKCEIWFYSTF